MRSLLLTVASVAALATAALAQPAPPAAPTPAAQSDELRQRLHLRPDQETALQAYVAAMRPGAGEADHYRQEAQRESRLPTPQRLDAMVARMDQMRTAMLARFAATRTFYGKLDPAQRAIFDGFDAPSRSERPSPR
jgi:hypothetical protein